MWNWNTDLKIDELVVKMAVHQEETLEPFV